MSIYICTKCGRVYDELPTVTEHYPYGSGLAPVEVACNMCRCGGDIQEAGQCRKCGGYFESYEVFDGLCLSCDLEHENELLQEDL